MDLFRWISHRLGVLPALTTTSPGTSDLAIGVERGPQTNPTGHGGKPEDAFHLIAPSLPGFGFSDKPTNTGWDVLRIAKAWIVLMERLG